MNDLYQVTVPVFKKSLTALNGLLVKAQAHLTATGAAESTLLDARLAPDMFPFIKQVQIACDNAKGTSARLAGIEAPVHADEEKTIADLQARISKTVEFISSIPEGSFAEAHTRHITLPYFPGKFLTAVDFTREYGLPNFFFHLVTAYAILRKEGVTIGKGDYLGGLSMQDMV